MIAWKGANKVDQTWMSLITDVGFPVAVTFYLLHRIETKLNTLIESIVTLPEKMK
ncbi:YvrJ family protein [Gracilibacillus dipsosauri]|uniref:YvrJ family protein n=1 Tax=Gracilibacillus dipsosauri TaxID=178340 RepID=A0A317KVE1_9BACI|nr:YvrJ family protein [Gracilibacillus dipsosauri]PWU67144.1 YvrJ family protein [Gracilibacillus dipsosauri]